jgi:hypothetical protein
MRTGLTNGAAWPALSYATLKATCETLQLWTQVVGKVRLAQTPWLNHSWHVPLYVTARGLATSLIPHRAGAFDMEFDFVGSVLSLRTSTGAAAATAVDSRLLRPGHGHAAGGGCSRGHRHHAERTR